jgi:Domain of unknown function (DUF4157)
VSVHEGLSKRNQQHAKAASPSFHQSTVHQAELGRPLSPNLRFEMESSFGQDLSDVVVHNDSESHMSNASRGFDAYTIGSHIYFGEGRFDPSSTNGRGLLGHEVTHVLQQRDSTHRSSLEHAARSTPAEMEARRAGAQVRAGHAVEQVSVPSDISMQGAESAAETVPAVTPVGADVGGPTAAPGAGVGGANAEQGLPPALEAAIAILDSPKLQAALSAVLPSSLAPNLKKMKLFLLGAWAIWQNPSIVIDPVKAAFAQLIEQIPGRAQQAIDDATAKYGEGIGKHLSGIWRHLKPKLLYLKDNAWDVLKDTGRGLLFPWEGMSEDIDKISALLVTAKQEFTAAHWSKGADAVIDAWRAGNNLAGRWYGWFVLAMALIGGIVGAIFGAGVGFVPGVLAGAEIAFSAGKLLLASTIAAEGVNLAKSLVEMTSTSNTEVEREEDYERIASSGLTLGIIGVMFVIGEIVAKFVQWLFRRLAKALGKELPAPKQSATEASAAKRGQTSPQELERAKAIKEGYEQRDAELEGGRKAPRKGYEDDLDWLGEDPHKKDLAYDPDAKHYRINEGKAAIAAEESGVLDGPLRRAPESGQGGIDFLDAKGRLWSHKGGDLPNVVSRTVGDAKMGTNVLADLSELNPAQRVIARAQIAARLKGLSNAGAVRFVPAASPATVGEQIGGVLGKQVAEHSDNSGM